MNDKSLSTQNQLYQNAFISEPTLDLYLKRFEYFSSPLRDTSGGKDEFAPPYWATHRTGAVAMFKRQDWGEYASHPDFEEGIKTIIQFLLTGLMKLFAEGKDSISAFDVGTIIFDPELLKTEKPSRAILVNQLNNRAIVNDILGAVFSTQYLFTDTDTGRLLPIGDVEVEWMLDFFQTAWFVRGKLSRLASLDSGDAEDRQKEEEIQAWLDAAKEKKISRNAFIVEGGSSNQPQLPAFISTPE